MSRKRRNRARTRTNQTGQRRKAILDLLHERPMTVTVLAQRIADRFDMSWEAACQSVSAHLDRLVTDGKVIQREDLYEAVRERF